MYTVSEQDMLTSMIVYLEEENRTDFLLSYRFLNSSLHHNGNFRAWFLIKGNCMQL